MKRSRSRNVGEAAKLEMTPMIDVVFQLLIFFIVTLKKEDILAHLDVSRPAPSTAPPVEKDNELLEVIVYDHKALGGEGYSMRGRKVALKSIRDHFKKIVRIDKDTSVIIKCELNSPHDNLMNLLNVCADVGLNNIAVFSM